MLTATSTLRLHSLSLLSAIVFTTIVIQANAYNQDEPQRLHRERVHDGLG